MDYDYLLNYWHVYNTLSQHYKYHLHISDLFFGDTLIESFLSGSGYTNKTSSFVISFYSEVLFAVSKKINEILRPVSKY